MVGFHLFTGLYYYQYIVYGWFSPIFIGLYYYQCIVSGWFSSIYWSVLLSVHCLWLVFLYLLVCIIISTLLVVGFPLFTGPDYYQYIACGWFSSIYWSVLLSVHCFWLVFIYLLVCIIISTLLVVGFHLFTGLYYYQYIVCGWFSSIYWSVLLSVHCLWLVFTYFYWSVLLSVHC